MACQFMSRHGERAPRVVHTRLLVVGASRDRVCGVRDYARLLNQELVAHGVEVATIWNGRRPSFTSLLHDMRSLLRAYREFHPDAVILHYSVFAYAWRGIPLFVPTLSFVLHRLGVPLVLVGHEFAYTWGRRGWRGAVHAITQRVALLPLVVASSALVVTTQDRVDWLRSRWWLPPRPVAWAPVFSNIPMSPARQVQTVPGRVGIFGFGTEGLATELVMQSVARVRVSVSDAHLVLIGGPGRDSAAGFVWQCAADKADTPITFTGIGTEEEISSQIAACEVIFHADPAGPTSRKTTLAAALSHGRPVLALDGPHRWNELVDAGAIKLTEPRLDSAAKALRVLLTNKQERAGLGARAQAFAERRLSPEHTSNVVLHLTEQLISTGLRP